MDWISVKKRLPDEELKKRIEEKGENAVVPVLTARKINSGIGVRVGYYFRYIGDKPDFYSKNLDRLVDVVAWFPFPDPPKEGDLDE